MFPRPTIRCYYEYTGNDRLPDVQTSFLHNLNWNLLAKATTVMMRPESSTKLSYAKDNSFYKCKYGQRERGALYIKGQEGWLVSAGIREKGSEKDFYNRFEIKYSSSSEILLPTQQDYNRLSAERKKQIEIQNEKAILNKINLAESRPGKLEEITTSDFSIDILVKLEDGIKVLYVAILVFDPKSDVDSDDLMAKIISLIIPRIDPQEALEISSFPESSLTDSWMTHYFALFLK